MKENNNNTNNQLNSKESKADNTSNKFSKCSKMLCYKSFFSSKVFIAIIFVLIGFGGATCAQNRVKDKISANQTQSMQSFEEWSNDFDKMMQNQHQRALKVFNEDPFFSDNGIFREMAVMEKNMSDMFAANRRHIAKIFDENYKNNVVTNKTFVSTREDKSNYYYDLAFSGFKKEDIAVVIKNNNLTFSARHNQDKDSKNQKLESSTSFYYSFSLPKYNTKIDPEITKTEGKITVKFVKEASDNKS